MSQAQVLTSPAISLVNDRPATTTLAIAEAFGKRHDDVVKSIRNLSPKCPEEFTARNFAVSEYTDSTGRRLPMFTVFFDGFMLLVMGYTGKKALQMKLAYIAAFNAMTEKLDKLAEEERARLSANVKPEFVGNSDKLTLSTPDSRKPLRALVHAWAQIEGVHHAALWPQVKAHFQLSRIDDLPEEWIPDALAFVQEKIDGQRKALPPTGKKSSAAGRAPSSALPFSPASPDDAEGHLAAIREHIRHIHRHEEALFLLARKAMPLRGAGPSVSLASLIHRNMENAGWSLHYALESMEASARFALVAGRG